MSLPSFFGRCAAIVAMAGACLPAARAELPMVELGAGMYRIEAELAHTDQARQIGLMNRTAMPLQHGMVFAFAQDARHCMWMKNTLIPLSVAFMDREGRILNVAEMKPQTEDSHCAAAPARFALEMNAGWFAARGIGAGTVIRGVDRLPAGR
ncbi:DUF192 domain-containing protein [Aromatoleum toluclasticum]|uniref:DUF192 domain-containing protein n=1 Tax=Aromatoleum toluclasticum TaxID=92003 RepID=UPI003F68F179